MFMFPIFIEHNCSPVIVSILETYLWYRWNYDIGEIMNINISIDTSEYSNENK